MSQDLSQGASVATTFSPQPALRQGAAAGSSFALADSKAALTQGARVGGRWLAATGYLATGRYRR